MECRNTDRVIQETKGLTPKAMKRLACLVCSSLLGTALLSAAYAAQPGAKSVPLPARDTRTNAVLQRPALTNVFSRPPLAGARTNPIPGRPGAVPGKPKTVAGKSVGTNAPSAATATNTVAALKATFRAVEAHPAFYPAVIGIGVCLVALILLRGVLSRKKQPAVPVGPVAKAARAGTRPASVHACNVLDISDGNRQIWQFDTRGGNYVLSREHVDNNGKPLPGRMVGKDWRSLFYRKLNIAWVPPEHVFLRVIQLPRSDFNETLSMVELQLEKLSPMPVAQVVWSLQVLPHTEGNLQTAVVTIVARNVVEEFLGKLEGQGYLADRLEFSLLDQLQTTAITDDGAWIYPENGTAKNTALVAWW